MKQNRLQNSDIQQNPGNTFVFKYLLQQQQKMNIHGPVKKLWHEMRANIKFLSSFMEAMFMSRN